MTRVGAPLRILHLFRTLDAASGGPLTYLATLHAALDPARVHMAAGALVAGTPSPQLPPPLHLGTPGLGDARNARAYARWLGAALATADVVHLHGVFGWHFVAAARACLRRGVPYVCSSHGLLTDWYLGQGRLRKQLYLRLLGLPLLRRAARIVTLTETEDAYIAALDPALRCTLVRPGVPALAGAASPGGAMRLLFLGRLSRVKGLPLLLAALAELRRAGHDVVLTIAGAPSRDYGVEGLEDDLDRLGVRDAVTVAGALAAGARDAALRDAHVLVLPSYSENFSFAAAEALAAGLPAIVTEAVGMAGLIRREDCGSVVPPGDADALGRALADYLDPAVRTARAARARACAQRELSLEAMAHGMEALYRECASR